MQALSDRLHNTWSKFAKKTEMLHFREFEVDSNHFVGQVHRWRLSLLLQKGTRRAHNTLLDVSFTKCKLQTGLVLNRT